MPVTAHPAFHHLPSMLQICVPAATKKFSEQVKSKDLTVHWIEGGAHDMMQGGSSAMGHGQAQMTPLVCSELLHVSAGHEGPTIQTYVIDWLKIHT